MTERYFFDTPQEDTSPHNILDYCYNLSAQQFLIQSRLETGGIVL